MPTITPPNFLTPEEIEVTGEAVKILLRNGMPRDAVDARIAEAFRTIEERKHPRQMNPAKVQLVELIDEHLDHRIVAALEREGIFNCRQAADCFAEWILSRPNCSGAMLARLRAMLRDRFGEEMQGALFENKPAEN